MSNFSGRTWEIEKLELEVCLGNVSVCENRVVAASDYDRRGGSPALNQIGS